MTEIQALLVGVVVGVPVQLAASILRYSGKWRAVDLGRKVAMSATGGIAAFVVGLWYLSGQPVDPGSRALYKLWLYQTVAAWGGAIMLDVIAQSAMEAAKRVKGGNGGDK